MAVTVGFNPQEVYMACVQTDSEEVIILRIGRPCETLAKICYD